MAKEIDSQESVGGFKFKYCFYIAVVILFILALYSHRANDFSVLQGGSDAPIGNWIGITGAHISCLLLLLFGLAAWPLTIFLVICAVRPILPYPTRRRGYFGALLVIILGVTLLFGMYPAEFAHQTANLGIGHRGCPEGVLSGGVIGQQLAAPKYGDLEPGVLRHYIGSVGTMTVAMVFLVVGLFFVYRADWHSIVTYIFTRKLPAWSEKIHREEAEEKTEAKGKEEKETEPEEPRKSAREIIAEMLAARRQRKAEARKRKLESEEVDEEIAEADYNAQTSSGGSLMQRIMSGEKIGAAEIEEEAGVIAQAAETKEKAKPEPKVKNAEPEDFTGTIPAPQPEPVRQTPPPAPVSKPESSAPAPTVSKRQAPAPAAGNSDYVLPPITMLTKAPEIKNDNAGMLKHASETLQQTLESFKVDGQVTGVICGPRVVRYEISLAPGVKVEKVANIASNIAMEMEAESIRILAPIPGQNAVGVEAPNPTPSGVFIRSVMEAQQWKESKIEIPVVLGKDVTGKPVVMDLAKAPHLLIAGSTGSGKSVCMNTLIMSLLMRFRPDEMRLIMVDPKVVEMAMYTVLPHLITPVVNDPHKIPLALRWAVNEMEKRYRILAKAHTRNLAGYNSRPKSAEPILDDYGDPIPEKMPYLVIIIDELADVMMTDAKSDVETSIARIAQKGRAAGIHVVIATQRPSTNIITGVIKANLPTRIAFKVGSIVDSRVILDQKGAESLLGRGDMLFVPPGSANLERIQGAMVDDADIEKVVEFVAGQAEQHFDSNVTADQEAAAAADGENDDDVFLDEDDDEGVGMAAIDIDPIVRKYLRPEDGDLVRKALEITLLERKVSTSYLQRRLGIGYNRAAEIIDKLEERGIVSAPLPGGSKRDILVFDEIENAKA